MLSVRVPLATIADPQQQQLSPLKGLSLADKENTVSAPGGGGRGQGGGVLWVGEGAGRPLTIISLQPPSLSGTRVLASKTARRIFQEPSEPVSRWAAAGARGEGALHARRCGRSLLGAKASLSALKPYPPFPGPRCLPAKVCSLPSTIAHLDISYFSIFL